MNSSTSSLNNFNADDPSNFGVTPGVYTITLTQAELKGTKAGTGTCLHLVWQVCDGEFSGEQVYQYVTVENANATAERIGRKQLATIMRAVGVHQLPDSGDVSILCNKPVQAELAIEEDAAYGPKTIIRKFVASGGNDTVATDSNSPF